MKAYFKEITTDCGLKMWVCMLDDKEIARAMSFYGAVNRVLHLIRNNKNGKQQ